MLELRVAEHPDDPYLSAGLAHHYLSGGDQPAALAAAVRAAGAAEAVRAHGEAAQLLERALDIWDRVPDAQELTGTRPGRSCWPAWAPTSSGTATHARAQATLERALDELGPDADPHAAAGVLDRLALAQWRQGRADEARASIARALALLPEDDSPERARILARNAKVLMLQGALRECVPAAREAIDVARRAQEREARGRRAERARRRADPDRRRRRGRERRCVRRSGCRTSPGDAASAYVNLADSLHVAGLSQEALEVAHEGLAARRRVPAAAATGWR